MALKNASLRIKDGIWYMVRIPQKPTQKELVVGSFEINNKEKSLKILDDHKGFINGIIHNGEKQAPFDYAIFTLKRAADYGHFRMTQNPPIQDEDPWVNEKEFHNDPNDGGDKLDPNAQEQELEEGVEEPGHEVQDSEDQEQPEELEDGVENDKDYEDHSNVNFDPDKEEQEPGQEQESSEPEEAQPEQPAAVQNEVIPVRPYVSSKDKQMDGVLTLIKELLEKVKAKRQAEAAEKAQVETATLEQQNIEQQPTLKTIYLSFDGDSIGNKVAQAEETDNEQVLAEVSRRINDGQDAMREWAIRNGGEVIEAGGDEGLIKLPGEAINKAQEAKEIYEKAVGTTVTIGIGNKISESTKARMLGKLKGKNQIVIYDESVPKELEIRAKEQSEADKLKTGGLI